MARPSFSAARKATKQIAVLWDEAESHIRYMGTNGAGVLYDHPEQAYKLRTAKRAIEKALAIYEATDWPADEDYE